MDNTEKATGVLGQEITCSAAVSWGPGQPFSIQQIRVQPPQKLEVRIRILYTSVCHTDLSAWQGENESQRMYPRIFGHEASGVVECIGEGVEDMEEGDHVLTIFNGECRECAYCKSESTNLCEKFRVDPLRNTMRNDGKTRFLTQEGKPIYHFLNTSTFSEYTVIDSACVVKIDPKAPLDKMTLLSCCVSTGYGAVTNDANIHQGSTVAVFGLGAVGLAVIHGAKTRGASRIIGVDINADKDIKGKTMGMTDFINPRDLKTPAHEKIREITEGGVDFSFECAGNLDVLREAFLSTHDGWGLTIVLGIHPTPRMLPLHPMELFDGRRITGSVFGGFKGKSQLPIFAHQCMHQVCHGYMNLGPPLWNFCGYMYVTHQPRIIRCMLVCECGLVVSGWGKVEGVYHPRASLQQHRPSFRIAPSWKIITILASSINQKKNK